jgi:predicted nucleotidyltransferase
MSLDPLRYPHLKEIVRRVVKTAQPERILVFGSAARGEAGPESDIDLLVIKKGVYHRRRLAQQIYVNLIGIPVPVDVVVVTPEDIERFKDSVGSIIPIALEDGVEVYGA